MKLHGITTRIAGGDARPEMTGAAGAGGTDPSFFLHAHVPILDNEVLDDDDFEPDGVNDFIRAQARWDPDREF